METIVRRSHTQEVNFTATGMPTTVLDGLKQIGRTGHWARLNW